jgi:hypothetical protein
LVTRITSQLSTGKTGWSRDHRGPGQMCEVSTIHHNGGLRLRNDDED